MPFRIEADVDHAATGARRAGIPAAERAATAGPIRRGAALGERRKADGSGVIGIWSAPDRAACEALIAALPIRPLPRRIVPRELAEHPLFPGGRLA